MTVAHRDELFEYMVESHRLLDIRYQRLLDAMAVGAPEVCELWTQLDHDLLSHLEGEERYVLPAFAHFDREEAVALLQEHGRVRVQLLELGVAVDLHELRHKRSIELVELLRAHAAREENLLYRWADRELDPSLKRSVLEHVACDRVAPEEVLALAR
ncbi:hypothetical protein BH11MYX1_BH11MYX1_09870 [soil metagenome]